jgi:hypothetical protein
VPATIRAETKRIRHSRRPDSSRWFAGRAGRRIAFGSAGSKARLSPSATAVIMLIQSICTGVTGSVRLNKIARTMVKASPPLVGSVQVMTLVRLS